MRNILWLCFAITLAFFSIIAVAITLAAKSEKKIYNEGTEIEGIVVRNTHHFSNDFHSRYTCYVRYIGDDGSAHDGALNILADLPIGRKVVIRYLPGKYDTIVFVSQSL